MLPGRIVELRIDIGAAGRQGQRGDRLGWIRCTVRQKILESSQPTANRVRGKEAGIVGGLDSKLVLFREDIQKNLEIFCRPRHGP